MTGIGFAHGRRSRPSACCCSGAGRLRAVAALPARRDLGDRAAVPRERGRLDLHRDGPPAVGRPGPAEDVECRVAERVGLGGRADARRLHAALRRARGRRRVADVPLRASEPPARRRTATTDGVVRARPTTSPWRTEAATMPTGYWHLRDALVRADRDPLDRLLRARGVRLRRRHAAAVPGRGRHRQARDDQHDRAGLGRQRGVAARRRRRDVRCLPGLVRHAVLGLLPRAVPDPRRADRARRRLRVPRQARFGALAGVVGSRDLLRLRASCAALGCGVREHACKACRSTRTASTPARC